MQESSVFNEAYQASGKIASLWAKSNLHSSWSLESFEKFVYPPLLNRQFLLLETKEGIPLAYVSWAFMSVEVEARYLSNPAEFYGDDWRSGDRLWIMDFVSPVIYGRQPILEVKQKIKNEIFPNAVARSLSVRKGRDRSKIVRWVGANVTLDRSQELFAFYRESVKELVQMPNIIWERS